MATYKGIQGTSVQSLASDPSPTASVEGQLWYNSASNVWKISTSGVGAWSSGGNLNVGEATASGVGISQNSALCIGGSPDGSNVAKTTESYDGTTWTEVADMALIRRYFVGVGTQTAALACGGTAPPIDNVESWDGTSWTEIADLVRSPSSPGSPSQSGYATGFGSTTSAMFNGGSEGPNQLDICEQYNGTSWSEVADLNGTRSYGFGAGTSGTAGLCTGGKLNGPSTTDTNEVWDGTSWTEAADINTARSSGGASNQGTVTASLIFGGLPPETGATEKWNGTSWTEVGDLATARSYMSGAGVATTALAFGGDNYPGASLQATEEWADPLYSVETVTTS
jgi:hypothetical protein